jgi:hypothetical protein
MRIMYVYIHIIHYNTVYIYTYIYIYVYIILYIYIYIHIQPALLMSWRVPAGRDFLYPIGLMSPTVCHAPALSMHCCLTYPLVNTAIEHGPFI